MDTAVLGSRAGETGDQMCTEADRAAAGGPVPARGSSAVGRRSAGPAAVPAPRGTKDDPFDEQHLLAHVRSFLASGAPTLADVGTFGGRAVVWATVRGVPVYLNVDSSRAALQQFVDAAARGPLPWSVIANRKGQLNKVTFRVGERVPGFYCYTTVVQAAAGPLGGVAAVL